MRKDFQEYIQKEHLFAAKDKVLLAVSGGVDSMVMMHLFKESGFRFGIAHCNFQLRGEASEADAQFVENKAKEWEVPLHLVRFETEKESKAQKKSIELMAREQRYKWFLELMQQFDYQYVATAHHLNDSLETILYNLTKGTGIRGLHGIPVRNEAIIRPLSFTNRIEIEDYAKEHQIEYREDASNDSTLFHRNLIRKEVVTSLKKINPSLEKTFAKTLHHLQEVEMLFHWAVKQHLDQLVEETEELIKINIAQLKKEPARNTLLYEIIHPFGFNTDHVEQVFRAIDTIGAQFYSKTHQILIDRKMILVKKRTKPLSVFREMQELPNEITIATQTIYFESLPYVPVNLNQGKLVAIVDVEKIKYPLVVRNWREGDRFQPLGMGGKSKKLKDYLKDEKVSRIEKEKVLLLESAGEIVWVIGHRQDERFKIDEHSSQSLRLIVQVE